MHMRDKRYLQLDRLLFRKMSKSQLRHAASLCIAFENKSSRDHLAQARKRRSDVTFVVAGRKAADCEVATLLMEPYVCRRVIADS